MAFVLPPPLPPPVFAREESEWEWQRGGMLWSRDLFYCDPTRHELASFKVGGVFYCLLHPVRAIYEPPIAGKSGRLIAHGLEKHFVGKGPTLEEAREDWQLQIDFAIQQLLATQDFERTVEEQGQWRVLCQYFDLNEIRYSRPLRIRAYGRLLSNHSRKFRVRWIDGEKHVFTREQIADEMVAFRPGQPFEAVVLREPRTWRLLRIESAFPARNLPEVSDQEARELLAGKSVQHAELEWD